MADHVERLRALVRLDWPDEVRLLVNTLSEDEWARLEVLVHTGREPSRAAVRRCLDPVPGVQQS
jgi:hypothetical protein